MSPLKLRRQWSLGYEQPHTPSFYWRNRAEFIAGRAEIEAFLVRKWHRELDYRLIKEVWAHDGNRIAVRFAYEWHDDSGHMRKRYASINDLPITEAERKYRWPSGRRPDDHPGLSALGL